ncbi:Coproporphyrinogen III oxidase [Proteiniphilum saccharofermentans]|uniref:Heme chaperone HemW n=1 Tax=Proteiniphilum saccharofermentans TaxID=1642647 RepID=A0A1R3SUX7_9BACT|nr:radical SAM family heme chaperone HemW [Proteiniphilum saccharofermentans]SCD20113.1 Coproporphyrinogen III oxidase [Proteiniphilum saccharofermentans]SDZ87130.1 oxygen-independent coproporphyrinogen-3 oxidase [Porphyromonadaceae bacterium KH3R12]SFS40888.1 oxygen-independent coproporphyrinogen-3 oxidase [Porphyromonadaceae bacterium NLAE-zl-C104]
MAGIYIHIPFCKIRCTYCDFYTGTNETQMDAFVDALCVEARIRKDEISEPVKTIYFGGGTPSRLRQEHFERIFDVLLHHYSIVPEVEITVEANPDDLSEAYVEMLSRLPLNRLSMGIQSFNDGELKFLSRRHSAQQAIDAVRRCQQHGFGNISIDLMYGLPQQTEEIWRHNLTQAIALDVPHISSYHLIYEEKTKMYRLLQAGRIKPAEEELSTAMFAMLIDRLTSHGYIHYEISAFGKEGHFSRHNSSYWKNEKYLGLGPAAHSFDGDNRTLNVPSLMRYIKGVESGVLDRETEHLSLSEKYNEAILTGLRTMWGLDLTELTACFGNEFHHYCMENARKYLDRNLLRIKDGRMKLTREGIFISDGIMSDLMWVG